MTARGLVSTALGKAVAHKQAWRCSICGATLPPSYQIDHIEPLWRGGADREANLQALCPNCHASKTHRESIERLESVRAAARTERYEAREDKYHSATAVQCLECGRVRRVGVPHSICWAIEGRPDPADPVEARLTALFAAQPTSARPP